MKVSIVKEIEVGERRVAVIPDIVSRLVKQGMEVWVEAGAGEQSFFSDAAYEAAGAKIATDTEQLWHADLVLKVNPPQEREDGRHEADLLKEGATLIGFLNPLGSPALIQRLAERKVTAFGLELIPRTSRAQSMDALSSQAGVAGYKAVLLAAAALPKFFPMLTTAAGTIAPAKVLIIGAGVAAGGYALEVSEVSKQRTQAAIAEHVKLSDVVITTAQVPGRQAPRLVTADMIAEMKPGSVIVDLAADQGGNCEGSEAGKTVVKGGVTLIGEANLPSTVPFHASQMYAKNILTLVQFLVKDGVLTLNFDDDIVSSACVTHGGEVKNQRVKDLLGETVGAKG
jgi:H+-translocating NAD(P) transhydrogenase subunit alpha